MQNIDPLSSQYKNILPLEDFNSQPNEESMSTFCQLHSLEHYINEPTRFKNSEKSTIIDLTLTIKPKSFQHSCTLETGISNFHKMSLKGTECVTFLCKSYY